MFPTLAEKLNPAHTAIVVVDMQNDFCSPNGYMHREGRSLEMVQGIIPTLKDFISVARSVSVPIIFLQAHYGNGWFLSPAWLDRANRANPAGGHLDYGVCVEGTWGFDFHEGFGPSADHDEVVIKKHRYSGFVGTELDLTLRSRSIKTVVMTGTATNVCVESTARDAFMRDYYVVMLSDCCATVTEEEQQAALSNIRKYFGEVVLARDVVQAWADLKSPSTVSRAG